MYRHNMGPRAIARSASTLDGRESIFQNLTWSNQQWSTKLKIIDNHGI